MTAYNDAVTGLTTLQNGTSGADAATMAAVWPSVQTAINAMAPADTAAIKVPTPGYQDLVDAWQAAQMGSAGYDSGVVHDAAANLLPVVNAMVAAHSPSGMAPTGGNVVVIPPAQHPAPSTAGGTTVVVQQPAAAPMTVSLGAVVMIAIGAILVGGAIVHFWGPEIFGEPVAVMKNPLPRKRPKKKRRKKP